MQDNMKAVVAIFVFNDDSIYLTTCATDEYNKLKEIVYAKASVELKKKIDSGCQTQVLCHCSFEYAPIFEEMLIKRLTKKHRVLNCSSIFKPKKPPTVTKSILIKDCVLGKETSYSSIKEASEELRKNYNTLYKYIGSQKLLDGRYLISYSEPVERPISEEEAVPDTFIEEGEEEPLNDEFRALDASGDKYAGKSFVLWDLYSGEKAKRYQSMEELLEDNPEITEPQAYEVIENKLKLKGRIRIMLEEEYEDMILTI